MTKFGKYLAESSVPEWKSQYVNYKKLKKILHTFPPVLSKTKSSFTVDQIHSLKWIHSSQQNNQIGLMEVGDNSRNDLEKQKQDDLRDDNQQIQIDPDDSPPNKSEETEIVNIDLDHLISDERAEEGEVRQVIDNMDTIEHRNTARYTVIDDPFTNSKRIFKLDRSSSIKPKDLPISPVLQQIEKDLDSPNTYEENGRVYLSVESKSPEKKIVDIRSLIPSDLIDCGYEEDFFEALENEIFKAVSFYEKKLNNFNGQIDLALHCLKERQIAVTLPSKEREEKLKKLPKIFRGGKRSIRPLFRDLHYGLNLLKNFLVLNYLAIVKILKKHDKLTPGWKNSSIEIIPKLDSHEIYPSPDPLGLLVVSLEKIFVKYLSGSKEKSEALDNLRRHDAPEGSHLTTFLAGFSFGIVTGLTFAAFITFAFLYSKSDSNFWDFFLFKPGADTGIEAEFAATLPVIRFLFLISFHILLWGIDVLFYERRRINVRFIMDADPRSFLQSNQIVFIATGIFVFIFADVLLYGLAVSLKDTIRIENPGYIPLAIFLIFILVSIMPFPILFYKTRKYFWITLMEVFLTPFRDVTFQHFFMADQLVSAGIVLLDLQYSLVYYFSGEFLSSEKNITFPTGLAYQKFSLFLTLLPYWFRFGQCIRRAVTSGHDHVIHHMSNAIKYSEGILAAIFSYAYHDSEEASLWKLWLFFKVCGSLHGFFWDIFQDWSLLKFTLLSRFPFIEFTRTNQFHLKNVIVAVINFFLRMAFILNFWIFTTSASYGASFNREMSVLFLSILEIYRRGQWNVLRLENEHYNNCGKFRAFKEIPEEYTLQWQKDGQL